MGASATMYEEVIRQRDIELEGKDERIRALLAHTNALHARIRAAEARAALAEARAAAYEAKVLDQAWRGNSQLTTRTVAVLVLLLLLLLDLVFMHCGSLEILISCFCIPKAEVNAAPPPTGRPSRLSQSYTQGH